jgi:hypothetical protein
MQILSRCYTSILSYKYSGGYCRVQIVKLWLIAHVHVMVPKVPLWLGYLKTLYPVLKYPIPVH